MEAMEDIQPIPSLNGTKPSHQTVLTHTPTPHTFDLGNLLLQDPNPLPFHPSPTDIHNTARLCAQSLLNQLLTTCPIHTSPDASVLMTLPPPTTLVPREKPLPKAKEKTDWEKFAEKKGIKASGKEGKGKMVFDEEAGEWVPKWGYKGKRGGVGEEWIVEVDERKEGGGGGGREDGGKAKGGEGKFGGEKREKRERARRNERKMRANERKGRKGVAGGG